MSDEKFNQVGVLQRLGRLVSSLIKAREQSQVQFQTTADASYFEFFLIQGTAQDVKRYQDWVGGDSYTSTKFTVRPFQGPHRREVILRQFDVPVENNHSVLIVYARPISKEQKFYLPVRFHNSDVGRTVELKENYDRTIKDLPSDIQEPSKFLAREINRYLETGSSI